MHPKCDSGQLQARVLALDLALDLPDERIVNNRRLDSLLLLLDVGLGLETGRDILVHLCNEL